MTSPAPVPPPYDPHTADSVVFTEWHTETRQYKYIVHYLKTVPKCIKGVRRQFHIQPYKDFYIRDDRFECDIASAYLIEDNDKDLYLAVIIEKATLHYEGTDEVLLSNWNTTSEELGEYMRFSPNSVFEPMRDSYPQTGVMQLVYFVCIDCRMPWFHKVDTLCQYIRNGMATLRNTIMLNLGFYHDFAVSVSYASKFGDYYNGYEQGSCPVINACCVTYSKLDLFPWLITLNPAQFVLYTDRLGDRPMMLKYKQYVRYMFAHNKSQSFINLQNCVVPMFDIPNDKPIKPTSVSKYAPYVKVLSYEAFEKVSTNVALNSKDMDEKEIKSVLEKISTDAVEVFGEPVEINKFPEHCQI